MSVRTGGAEDMFLDVLRNWLSTKLRIRKDPMLRGALIFIPRRSRQIEPAGSGRRRAELLEGQIRNRGKLRDEDRAGVRAVPGARRGRGQPERLTCFTRPLPKGCQAERGPA